jgi:hypothetical protein
MNFSELQEALVDMTEPGGEPSVHDARISDDFMGDEGLDQVTAQQERDTVEGRGAQRAIQLSQFDRAGDNSISSDDFTDIMGADQATALHNWDTEILAPTNLLQVDGANDSSEDEETGSGDDEMKLILQPLQPGSIGQVVGHYDQGTRRRLAVALDEVDTSDEEGEEPLDIPEEDVVSDRSDSPPPLEGGPGLSDDDEYIGFQQGQWV